MIYTSLTLKAMQIAYSAHHGQKDLAGAPYIFHPMHLAEQMKDEITTCIALLHDVMEDTDVSIEMLEKEFPLEAIRALKLLTHGKHYSLQQYKAYVTGICQDKNAAIVKLADVLHNMDESRLEGVSITDEKRAWHRKKYEMALQILEEQIYNNSF